MVKAITEVYASYKSNQPAEAEKIVHETMNNFIERSSKLMQNEISEWSERYDELQAKYDNQQEDIYKLEVKLMGSEQKRQLIESEMRKMTTERLDLEQSFIALTREFNSANDQLSQTTRKADVLEKNCKRLVLINESNQQKILELDYKVHEMQMQIDDT